MSRTVPQDEFIDTYKQDHTRAQWSARNALEAAKQENVDPELTDCLQELYDRCVSHSGLLQAYSVAQEQVVDPEVGPADNRLDRNYSSFVAKVETEIDLYGADSARGKAAQKMLGGPLRAPVHTVTNVHREEQESTMGTIIGQLANDFVNEIKTCELEAHFDVLQADFDEFVAKISVDHDAAAPTKHAIKASEERLRAKMYECIWRIGGAYPTTSESDLRMRSKLLGPFAIQNDRLAEFYRRNAGGQPPVVDPQTGEDRAGEDSPQPDEPVVEA